MYVLDRFEPAPEEVVQKAFDMLDIKEGEKHIELGSGDGRFLEEAQARGAESVGYEIDLELIDYARKRGLNVIDENCFNADVSDADVITCWFTLLPETNFLMDKLLSEMKDGSRLLKLGRSNHYWQPRETVFFGGVWLNLYVKDSEWL